MKHRPSIRRMAALALGLAVTLSLLWPASAAAQGRKLRPAPVVPTVQVPLQPRVAQAKSKARLQPSTGLPQGTPNSLSIGQGGGYAVQGGKASSSKIAVGGSVAPYPQKQRLQKRRSMYGYGPPTRYSQPDWLVGDWEWRGTYTNAQGDKKETFMFLRFSKDGTALWLLPWDSTYEGLYWDSMVGHGRWGAANDGNDGRVDTFGYGNSYYLGSLDLYIERSITGEVRLRFGERYKCFEWEDTYWWETPGPRTPCINLRLVGWDFTLTKVTKLPGGR